MFYMSQSDSNKELNLLLPDAIQVIADTIHDERDEENPKERLWSAASLSTSLWLIEKITGKAKTQDAESDSGLLRQFLNEIREAAKADASADPKTQLEKFTESKSKDPIDDFVEKYNP